jgi:hypothetical protein
MMRRVQVQVQVQRYPGWSAGVLTGFGNVVAGYAAAHEFQESLP